MNIKHLEKQVVSIVRKASKLYHNKEFFEVVEKHKYEKDDVTSNDIKTQEFLKSKLLKLIPGSCFIGEEGSEITDNSYVWIVDPIDGTQNYKKGLMFYATQLALQYNGNTILSVMYFPVTKQMYVATESGSKINGKPIKVSSMTDIAWSLSLMGNYAAYAEVEKKYKIQHKLVSNFKSVRLLGCAALNYALCAVGKVEAVVVFGNTVWDLEPGKYLVEKAGGVVYTNADINLHIAGNPKIVENIKKLLGV
jgi:myo-inositol-1(or 4)-monophosphatase